MFNSRYIYRYFWFIFISGSFENTFANSLYVTIYLPNYNISKKILLIHINIHLFQFKLYHAWLLLKDLIDILVRIFFEAKAKYPQIIFIYFVTIPNLSIIYSLNIYLRMILFSKIAFRLFQPKLLSLLVPVISIK